MSCWKINLAPLTKVSSDSVGVVRFRRLLRLEYPISSLSLLSLEVPLRKVGGGSRPRRSKSCRFRGKPLSVRVISGMLRPQFGGVGASQFSPEFGLLVLIPTIQAVGNRAKVDGKYISANKVSTFLIKFGLYYANVLTIH